MGSNFFIILSNITETYLRINITWDSEGGFWLVCWLGGSISFKPRLRGKRGERANRSSPFLLTTAGSIKNLFHLLQETFVVSRIAYGQRAGISELPLPPPERGSDDFSIGVNQEDRLDTSRATN